jgi:hypothetical protein
MTFSLQGLSHSVADLELWTLFERTNGGFGKRRCAWANGVSKVCSGWLLYRVDCARDVTVTIPNDLYH